MRQPRAAIIATVAAGFILAAPAISAEITGSVRVIDGDTLELAGNRIRLWGIDAPETRQTCEGRQGQTYECGRDSKAVMIELTRDRVVTCEPRDEDRYGRTVAVCRTEAGDINAAIVRRGWAVDWPRYSQGAYSREQEAARQDGLGIWAGRFQMPWDWRREHP